MIKVGIVGSTGYAGGELVRLLLQREDVEILHYGSRSYQGQDYTAAFPAFHELIEEKCEDPDIAKAAEDCDVIFTATPQGYLGGLLKPEYLEKCKFIDLSADYRIKDVATYEKWYKIEHKSPELLQEAVYGLPELNREKIAAARLIANPGCFPTVSFLSIYPLAKEGLIDPNSIVINALSGTSGAGRGEKLGNLFCEVNESVKAYGVTAHRHTPEIEQQLSEVCNAPVLINFTPHLMPMERGILVTATADLKEKLSDAELQAVYEKYYNEEYFVRVRKLPSFPETRFVRCSNFVDVAAKADPRTGRVVMMGAMDNMVKGAAGQAIQNMNLMFGLDETTGLEQLPTWL